MGDALADPVVDGDERALGLQARLHRAGQELDIGEERADEAGRQVGEGRHVLPRHEQTVAAEERAVIEEADRGLRRRSQGRWLRLPVRSQASAGGGSPPDVRTVAFEVLNGEVGHQLEAVEVVGECLEDELRKGEVVVVDLDGSPLPGDIVLAEHEGEWIFKIVERRGEQLFLVAHSGRPALRVDGERTSILGVALEASRRLARGRSRRPG